METGTKVEWTYTHHLNSKSRTQITKQGIFIREVKKKISVYDWDVNPYAIVKFDGNKGNSKVLLSELTEIQ